MVLDKNHDDEYLQDVYFSIIKKLGINDPPTISWKDLEKVGLDGLYDRRRNIVSVSTRLKEQPEPLTITIAHEITHFLLYKENYGEGAHGWPFLTLCALISYKIDLDFYYIINDNISNWRRNVNVEKWRRHFFIARNLIDNELKDNNWKNSSAHELTSKILKHNLVPASFFPRVVNFKTHKYFARTDGDIFLLKDSSVFFIVLSISFASLKLSAPFFVSLFFGLVYYGIYKYLLRFNSRYRLSVFWVRKIKNKYLHPVLAKFPWNKS